MSKSASVVLRFSAIMVFSRLSDVTKIVSVSKAELAVHSPFEWNLAKAEANWKKHSIRFEEASTVFADPQLITFLDEEHSTDEERYITIGLSDQNRLLMIAHTERNGRIRIISARKATNHERDFYATS